MMNDNPFKLNLKKVDVDGVLSVVIYGFDDKVDWDLTYKKIDRMINENEL